MSLRSWFRVPPMKAASTAKSVSESPDEMEDFLRRLGRLERKHGVTPDEAGEQEPIAMRNGHNHMRPRGAK